MRAAMKAVLGGALVCVAQASNAAQLLSFDFEQAPAGAGLSSPPIFVAPHLTVSAFSATLAPRNDFVGNNGGVAFGATAGWTSFNINRLNFTITVDAGYSLSLTDFGFDERSNGGSATMNSGPTAWQIYIADLAAPVASGTADNPWTPRQSGSLDLDHLTGTLTVYLTASGAPSLPGLGAGTWRIDNFELGGTVEALPPAPTQVPMPGMALMLTAGVLAMAGAFTQANGRL